MNNRDKFLKEQKILHLATIGPKGVLHVVPVWYMYSGKKFYVGTNTRTTKAKNLRKNKRVSFCVDIGIRSPKIYGVMGQGRVSLILEKAKVGKLTKKILLKYFRTLENKSAQELLDDTNCIIQIIPEKYSVWRY